MQLSGFLLACGLLQGVCALDPWYFTWTDPSKETHSESGSKPEICKEIDNPIGRHFEWGAGDGWCIYFWENRNCTGYASAGHTCKPWPWKADAQHSHLRSFKVAVNGTAVPTSPSDLTSASLSTSTTTSSTSSSTSSPISSPTNIPTSTPTADALSVENTDSSGSLSGGAIAGVVIGVLAGVALLAAAVWFVFFRRQKKPATTPESSSAPDPPATDNDADKEELVPREPPPAFEPTAELPYTPKEKPPIELRGDNAMVEMSDSHRVVELDATETVQRRY
ncbi:hypothetical protein EYZ11_008128 [Aspergillus tanneri]|uniref:Mid2 domain-containing protein n=1 Tax=Aspergillus tanneri TaxID=1220188 RepID=A0A4S3JDG6_9EURO|nr:uncharacterized protein ATNIH1004_002114 [Aspergillus tanneri]KAA8649443.1 hypothetical protein ATNIH1004_002114 [Aspergillus tanneri]THC92408.1 hypothetical protein EYZ11_008128 [Aspergillus tanneri]